ncbi:MAG: sulfite exporter TauE/SafE family protein [Pseudomonadota bacterium]
MLGDPTFLVAAVAAIAIAGLSKGGFGSGAAFAATPILALAVSPAQAAAILLPILMLMDLTGLYAYRKNLNLRAAWPLMAACVVGVGAGWIFFRSVDENTLRLMLGALALGFLAHQLLKDRTPQPPKAAKTASAALWGGLAGFTSFVAHAGGPLVAMHLIPQKLEKTAYQGATVLFFWWVNLIKLGPYAALGLLSSENLTTSLALAPLAPVAMLLGVWAHHRVSEIWFYRTIYALLAVTGVKLIWDGLGL